MFNPEVYSTVLLADANINSPDHRVIEVAISGGADSDIVLDICTKLDVDHKCRYCWCDTGIEDQATKDHLKYLEEKYGIEIQRFRPEKPVPVAVKEHGYPFISKRLAENIDRLQRHGFTWEDGDFETLYAKYPRCKSALRWWCNDWDSDRYNISHYRGLKEFMMQNPPSFRISGACCDHAKKHVAARIVREIGADLDIIGTRKSEGGERSSKKTCYTPDTKIGCDVYRIIFWWKEADRREYEEHFGIKHSACYEEYGMIRTGCCGCPFGLRFEDELKTADEHEPRLAKAVRNIFGPAYEYTRAYREFRNNLKQEETNDTE